MDIQKEREAFEEVFPCSTGTVLNEYGHYESQVNQQDAMIQNISWVVWRAAKAQAVPENITEKLESTANFMRGMCFDPRLHHDIRDAILERVSEIDSFIEAQEPAND